MEYISAVTAWNTSKRALLFEASIVQLFYHLFNSLLALKPNPPNPSLLLGKNVVLGQRVLNDIKFKISLAEMLPNYD